MIIRSYVGFAVTSGAEVGEQVGKRHEERYYKVMYRRKICPNGGDKQQHASSNQAEEEDLWG